MFVGFRKVSFRNDFLGQEALGQRFDQPLGDLLGYDADQKSCRNGAFPYAEQLSAEYQSPNAGNDDKRAVETNFHRRERFRSPPR